MRLLGIPNTKPPTKFEVSISSSFGDMFDRMLKIVGSRDLGHAHFQGKLFVRLLGISDTKQCTKFEVSISSSFGDMFDHMPKFLGVT